MTEDAPVGGSPQQDNDAASGLGAWAGGLVAGSAFSGFGVGTFTGVGSALGGGLFGPGGSSAPKLHTATSAATSSPGGRAGYDATAQTGQAVSAQAQLDALEQRLASLPDEREANKLIQAASTLLNRYGPKALDAGKKAYDAGKPYVQRASQRVADVASRAVDAIKGLTGGQAPQASRAAELLLAPGGRKLAQQIARFREAGGSGGPTEFLKHVNALAERARAAGNVVTGTIGTGPQAIANGTIYREGATYVVTDATGVIRSFVPNAGTGGIAAEFVRLGGVP